MRLLPISWETEENIVVNPWGFETAWKLNPRLRDNPLVIGFDRISYKPQPSEDTVTHLVVHFLPLTRQSFSFVSRRLTDIFRDSLHTHPVLPFDQDDDKNFSATYAICGPEAAAHDLSVLTINVLCATEVLPRDRRDKLLEIINNFVLKAPQIRQPRSKNMTQHSVRRSPSRNSPFEPI